MHRTQRNFIKSAKEQQKELEMMKQEQYQYPHNEDLLGMTNLSGQIQFGIDDNGFDEF